MLDGPLLRNGPFFSQLKNIQSQQPRTIKVYRLIFFFTVFILNHKYEVCLIFTCLFFCLFSLNL